MIDSIAARRAVLWIPPHVMVYASVAVMFVLTFAVVLGPSTSRGFRLGAWAIALVALAAPIDDLWHRRFGVDVTRWSPPHLLGLGGSALHTLACVVIAREV